MPDGTYLTPSERGRLAAACRRESLANAPGPRPRKQLSRRERVLERKNRALWREDYAFRLAGAERLMATGASDEYG